MLSKWTTVGILGLVGILVGCSDNDSNPNMPVGKGTVVVQFDHVVGATPLAFDSQDYTNAAGNAYSVTKLMYFVSDFFLHAPSEGGLRHEDDYGSDVVHFVDGRDVVTRIHTLADVPAGEYEAMSFTFGLDDEHNLPGAYPEYDADMEWPETMMGVPLGGGYHYMKLEGAWDATNGYTTHTGRNRDGLTAPLTDHSFTVEVDLEPAGSARHGSVLVVADEITTIHIVMDVNQWYEGPNQYDFADWGPIMVNFDAQQLLSQNGSTVFSALPVE